MKYKSRFVVVRKLQPTQQAASIIPLDTRQTRCNISRKCANTGWLRIIGLNIKQ